MAHELGLGHMRRENTEERRIEIKRQRRQGPDREQDHFAPQIIAYLDFFLVFVRGIVDLVVVPRLKKEVPGLPRRHGDQPARER